MKFEVLTVVTMKTTTFWDVILGSSTLKMVAACLSEMTVYVYQTKLYHIPGNKNFQSPLIIMLYITYET